MTTERHHHTPNYITRKSINSLFERKFDEIDVGSKTRSPKLIECNGEILISLSFIEIVNKTASKHLFRDIY